MRCVVGFYGLTRSLNHTAASIRRCIYAPLDRAGFAVRRAGHFNLPETITSERSGEAGLRPDRAEAALLDLDLRWIEPQDERAILGELEIGCAFPDRYGDGGGSLVNLCHQLYSLNRLWSLLHLLDLQANDTILLLRPDLLYLDELDPRTDIAPLVRDEADLIVPGWQSWGGLNDRLAICNRRAAEALATRITRFAPGCAALGGMHAERFLHMVAREAGLRVRHTGLRAVRVRANGAIAANDAAWLHRPELGSLA